MPEETRALTYELKKLRGEVQEVLELLRVERRRSWWHRAGSVVLAGLLIAVAFVWWDAEQDRCVDSNVTRADIRGSIVETVTLIVERTDNPEEHAALIGQIQDRLVETIPDRDCGGFIPLNN